MAQDRTFSLSTDDAAADEYDGDAPTGSGTPQAAARTDA
jgi:hypothetical protein